MQKKKSSMPVKPAPAPKAAAKPKAPARTTASAAAAAPGPAVDSDIVFVTAIANLLEQADVSEIEVERSGFKVRVSRHAPAPIVYAAPSAAPAAMAAPVAAMSAPLAAPPAAASNAADLSKHPGAVTSPMVGTAYLAPQPGAAPFVSVGDTVKEDQTLLIVEAMKTMNPIPSPKAGRITQIIVRDATPVEYGEVLMIIE